MATPQQWYVVVDKDGNALSFGTQVAEDLAERGLRAVAIDGPPNGRTWDKDRGVLVELPAEEARSTAAERRRKAVETARKPGATQAQKIDAIFEMLAGGA